MAKMVNFENIKKKPLIIDNYCDNIYNIGGLLWINGLKDLLKWQIA